MMNSFKSRPGLGLVIALAVTAASQPLLADVAVTEVDVSVSSSSVSASENSASTGDNPVRPVDEHDAFLGRLVTQYLDSFK